MIRALLFAALLFPAAFADTVTVSGDWVTLGDVLEVDGAAADRPIAATPAPGERLPLDPAFLSAQLSAAGLSPGEAPPETVWVVRGDIDPAAVTSRPGQIPVLARDIQRGEVISETDIIWIDHDDRRRVLDLVETSSSLVGMEATRNLKAERPLRGMDVKRASVVRKGEPVKLVFETAGLRLTVEARALADAARGEPVRVQNLQSNRSMDAIAWAEGEARVGAPNS